MFTVSITNQFQRQFSKLHPELKEEIVSKLELLKDQSNHQSFKVHKLKGRLVDRYGFSINYKIRIVFNFFENDEIILLAVGNHDVYR